MTVTNSAARIVQVTDPSLSDYSFPFKIFKATEVAVTVVGTTSRVRRQLAYADDFSVSGLDSDAGGTVSLTPAGRAKAGSGEHLVIARKMDMTQNINLRPHDVLPAETIERALDILTMEVQEACDLASRAASAPPDQDTPISWDDMVGLKESAQDAAARVAGEAASAAASASAARAARDAVAGHERLAAQWANNPEDEPVAPGLYSAYHWSLKARDAASGGAAVLAGNQVRPDLNGQVTLSKSDIGLDQAANLAPADLPVSSAQQARFEVITQALRRRLTAATTFYVRPDGNDGYDGSANTAAKALKSISGAMNLLRHTDFRGYLATVSLAPGDWPAFRSLEFGAHFNGIIKITSTDPNNAAFLESVGLERFAQLELANIGLGTGAAWAVCTAFDHSIITINGPVFMRSVSSSYAFLAGRSGVIRFTGIPVAFNGATYKTCVVSATAGGVIQFNSTVMSGGVTGRRYIVEPMGVIDTGNKGPNYIPGTVDGIVNSGGFYK